MDISILKPICIVVQKETFRASWNWQNQWVSLNWDQEPSTLGIRRVKVIAFCFKLAWTSTKKKHNKTTHSLLQHVVSI